MYNLYLKCKNSIRKLNNELNKFTYGTVENNKIIDLHEKFHTLPLSVVLKYKCGCCWELSLLEAEYFSLYLREIPYKLWYIQNAKYETHMWLSFQWNTKTIAFESAWQDFQGLHVYNTEKDMLIDYTKRCINVWDYSCSYFFAKISKFTANRLTPWQFMNIALNNSTFAYGNFNLYNKVKNDLKISDGEI